MVAVAPWEHYNADCHAGITETLVALSPGSRSSNLLPGCAAFLNGRLPVTLFQCRQGHGSHKLLFAVIIKLDDDVLVVAGHNRTKTKLRMFNLRPLGERWFTGHEPDSPSL